MISRDISWLEETKPFPYIVHGFVRSFYLMWSDIFIGLFPENRNWRGEEKRLSNELEGAVLRNL